MLWDTDPELSSLYDHARYLAPVSEAGLLRRLHGLLASLVRVEFSGDRTFSAHQGQDAVSLRDVLREYHLRDVDPQEKVARYLDRFATAEPFSDVAGIERICRDLVGHKCIFKYTEARFAQAILSGQLRLTLASSYNDPQFNAAIRDDELEIRHTLPGARLITLDGREAGIKADSITSRAAGNYYIGCFSLDLNAKLFTLFERHTCIVIKGADAYVTAAKRSFASYPEHHLRAGVVEYIDPHRRLAGTSPFELTKVYDFTYEREFRFVSFSTHDEENPELVQTIVVEDDGFSYEVVSI